MIKLTLGNSYSNISGLSPQQEKELREKLSYVVGGSAAYFSGYGVRRKSLLDKKGTFPTGLLHKIDIANLVGPYLIDDKRTDSTYCKVVSSKLLNECYPWQKEAQQAAIIHGSGVIEAPTGTGKSRAMYLIVETFSIPTLIVVPSLEIRKQLEQTFQGTPWVTIRNIDSPDLKTLTGFDLLILDECHKAASKTYRQLNKTAWVKIKFRLCFSATPFRNDSEEQLLFESIAGQVIYRLTYAEAVKNKYIVPVEAYVIPVPRQETDAFTYSEVYSELVVNNKVRNKIIIDMLTTLHSEGKSTLCLVREVAHGKLLADITGLPFVCGADDESRRYIDQFNKGNIKVLIGTEGLLSEGIDTRPCELVIIAGLGKAKSAFMQKCGRAVRNYPGKETAKVIIFRDASHKFLLRHYNAQRAILKEEYGVLPIKLEV